MQIIKIKKLVIAFNKKSKNVYHYFRDCKSIDKFGTYTIESKSFIKDNAVWETDFISQGKVVENYHELWDIISSLCLSKVRELKINELLNEQREVLQRPKRRRNR